jgi:hypothetical protein
MPEYVKWVICVNLYLCLAQNSTGQSVKDKLFSNIFPYFCFFIFFYMLDLSIWVCSLNSRNLNP